MIRLAAEPRDLAHFLSVRRSFGLTLGDFDSKSETYLDDLNDRNGRACFFAEDEKGRVVGYVQLVWADEEPHWALVHDLRIKANLQSRGWGRKLIAHLESQALERGFVGLRLWVESCNRRAQKFYQALGYGFTGAEDGQGGLLMVKPLSDR